MSGVHTGLRIWFLDVLYLEAITSATALAPRNRLFQLCALKHKSTSDVIVSQSCLHIVQNKVTFDQTSDVMLPQSCL